MSKLQFCRERKLLCRGRLASSDLPLLQTDGWTDNCNFSIMMANGWQLVMAQLLISLDRSLFSQNLQVLSLENTFQSLEMMTAICINLEWSCGSPDRQKDKHTTSTVTPLTHAPRVNYNWLEGSMCTQCYVWKQRNALFWTSLARCRHTCISASEMSLSGREIFHFASGKIKLS